MRRASPVPFFIRCVRTPSLVEGGEKLGIAVLLAQTLEVDGAEVQAAKGLAKGGKVDLGRVVLAVDDALLLHVERDDGELRDSGIATDVAQDRDEGVDVERLQGCGVRVLRREVDDDLHIERADALGPLDRGFLFERLRIGGALYPAAPPR